MCIGSGPGPSTFSPPRHERRRVLAKFVIVSTQRSGSAWVVDILNAQPGIVAYEEIFLRRSAYGAKTKYGDRELDKWNTFSADNRDRLAPRYRRIFTYLDQVYWIQGNGPAVAQSRGFKVMYDQLRRIPEILWYVRRHKIRIIHLIRRNTFDILLSGAIRDQIGIAHPRSAVERPTVYLDPHSTLKSIRKKETVLKISRSVLSRFGVPYREFFYEDLVEDSSRFLEVIGFIGGDRNDAKIESKLSKVNRWHYSEIIENYSALKTSFENTRYKKFLVSQQSRELD